MKNKNNSSNIRSTSKKCVRFALGDITTYYNNEDKKCAVTKNCNNNKNIRSSVSLKNSFSFLNFFWLFNEFFNIMKLKDFH